MTNLLLPDTLMSHAAKRLQAMADAISQGATLTDVATQFHVPVQALRRVTTPKTRKRHRLRKDGISQVKLAAAAKQIRDGDSYAEIARRLNVNIHTLKKALLKHGITMRAARAGDMDEAVRLYRTGVNITEIRDKTGISLPSLYSRLNENERRRAHAKSNIKKDVDGETLKNIQELYENGEKIKTIRERTGLHDAQIYRIVRKLGIFKPRRQSFVRHLG